MLNIKLDDHYPVFEPFPQVFSPSTDGPNVFEQMAATWAKVSLFDPYLSASDTAEETPSELHKIAGSVVFKGDGTAQKLITHGIFSFYCKFQVA